MKKRNKYILIALSLTVGISCQKPELTKKVQYTDLVNPYIGTDYHGHTFPGAALPGGMVQLSPDSDTEGWDWCSGYHYSDSSLMGFSHLHRSGMGGGSWGDILVMPTTGDLKVVPGSKENPDEGYRSRFSHERETASPGYYRVKLKDYNIQAELTVTSRAGFHRYTFPESEDSHIIIDLDHGIRDRNRVGSAEVKIVSNTEIAGHRSSNRFVKNKNVYFFAKFSKPFNSSGTWSGDTIKAGSTDGSGRVIGAFANFTTSEGEYIEVKLGVSYTSIEQAQLNLETEIPAWDFDGIKAAATERWNNALSKIEVQPSESDDAAYTHDKLVTFYSALYHALLFPSIFGDVDGKYVGMDGTVHTAEGFTYLSDFSLWDIYRAQMPLFTLVEPQRSLNSIRTMIAQYEQGGWLPTPQQFGNYCTNDMIGDHSVAVILDAYQKGINNFDVEKAYDAVRKNAMETPPPDHPSKGRIGLNYYLENGYIPYEKVSESVSRTLEYAYDDWCIAQLSRAIGKEDDYKLFLNRSENYKNVMDPATGLARPKDSNGKWLSPFIPIFVGYGDQRHYTEANAWQYTWFVPHDVQGLIDFEGGRQNFVNKLDTLFTMSSELHEENIGDITGLIGQYAHGNEPSHHTLYLYNYAGAPWKSQQIARKVMDEFYHSAPDGLCGNEDMGQMSAWYVLSAMGFYQVAPGQNIFVIGSPEFSKVVLHLDKDYYNSGELVIEAVNNSEENKYIQSATLNGKVLNRPWFSQEDIKNGASLTFQMAPEPNKNWGAGGGDAPPSLTGN